MPNMSNIPESLTIEVAFAPDPFFQTVISLQLKNGVTVKEALIAADVVDKLPGFSLDTVRVGIFSKKVTLETLLHDGDRIELYRPLVCDPKEARMAAVKAKRKATR